MAHAVPNANLPQERPRTEGSHSGGTRQSMHQPILIPRVMINTMDKTDEMCGGWISLIFCKIDLGRPLFNKRTSEHRRLRIIGNVLCGNFRAISSSQLWRVHPSEFRGPELKLCSTYVRMSKKVSREREDKGEGKRKLRQYSSEGQLPACEAVGGL